MRHHRIRATLVSLVALGALAAQAATGAGGALAAPAPLPSHVYAPYFETWTSDSITTLAQRSGVRYVTLAFLETTGKRSCTLA